MTHMITCLFTSHRLPSTSAHRSQQAASANSAELGCGHKNGVMMMVIHTNERRDPLQRVRDESVPIGGLWGGNEACSRRPPDPPSPHPVCMLASLPPVECGFIQHVPHRQVTVALWRGVHGESEQDVPHYPTPKLLSRVGFLERAHRVRRGEGGWEGRGGPLGLCCPIWSACTYIRMPLVSASEQSEKGASCDERALPAAAPAASFRCASD